MGKNWLYYLWMNFMLFREKNVIKFIPIDELFVDNIYSNGKYSCIIGIES